MSRILARITRGKVRIGTTKAALVLAVAGSLYFTDGGTTPPVTPPSPPINFPAGGGSGMGGGLYQGKLFDERVLDERRKRIEREDQEILLIIKTFLDAVD